MPRLVGRSAEHELLVRAVKAARLGRGGTVFVVGEAGIGKSRLAAHTIDEATTSGMLAVRGRASEFASAVPFRPMAEVILGLTRSGDASQATELVAYRSSLGRLVPDWRAAPEDDGDDGDSLLVLAEAVLRLAVHAARDRGCLIVLEDLHGADPETLAVVEYLMDNLAGRPVLVLGTVRAEPCVALDLARTATHRGSSSLIELTALTDDEVGQSVADRLDVPVDSVPEPVMARLIQGCGGNPFLAEEMLNDMIASGALARTGAGWRVVGDIPARVPAHVVQSLVRRADRLGEEARAVLRAGAMLGQRFPLDVVQRVTYIDDRTLLNHIHAAVAAQLLVPDDAPDWYRFRHALTAEALLDELRPAGRVELARRIADVIEQRYPDLRGPWCQLAAELRLAAGDSTVAGRLFLAAGRRAFADDAAVSAVKLLEQARTLLSDSADDAAFADVLEALLLALLEVGRIDEALTLVDTFDV
ncbi:MAG: ATP-binding protein, partial [Micromonosporaceae bacterium]